MKQSLYKCDKCSDTGWITKYRDDGSRYVISCECRKKKILERQWKKSGININDRKQSFTTFEVWNENSREIKEVGKAFYRDFSSIKSKRQNSIILCGQPGCGKTHLAVALAVNFISKGISVMYMPYRNIITEIKQNIMNGEQYQKIIDKYKKCEVLLIDDLYKGKVNESDINIMFEVINYRYLNYLPMIITSEFIMEKLLEFDESIGSRIYEMCKGYTVEVPKNRLSNYRVKDKYRQRA